MKVSQVKVGATINLGEYSDIRPEVTVELDKTDTPEEAQKLALEQINNIWSKTDNKQLQTKTQIGQPLGISTAQYETLTCFISDTEVLYDDAAHTYFDKEGNAYTSGSKFAHEYSHEFNKAMIIPKSAKKLDVEPEVVESYWQSKADISTTFGTALHKALEHYGKYKELCDRDVDSKTGMTKGTGIHPTLLPIVEAFFEKYGDEKAEYEIFIADKANLRCGQVDRAVITGPKTVIIDDYKTNGSLFKQGAPKFLKAPYQNIENTPFGTYRLQFSFYRAIFMAHGWKVEAMRLHHWNGADQKWDTYKVEAVEIDGAKRERIDISQVV